MEPEFEIEDGCVMKYNGKGGDVVIPDGVKEISSYAFYRNASIMSVTIPESVEVLYSDTFYHCGNLSEVNLPKHMKARHHRWPNYAFEGTPWAEEMECRMANHKLERENK